MGERQEQVVEKIKVPTTTVVQGEADQPGEVKPERGRSEEHRQDEVAHERNVTRRETHEVEKQERTETEETAQPSE